jgi:mRNA interferase HigB
VHVFSRVILRSFCEKHADSCEALYAWYRLASKANWQNLAEVQRVYPTAEAVGNFTVFNIKGNKYRLIVDLVYAEQRIFVKHILTHAEYDKNRWKDDPYF